MERLLKDFVIKNNYQCFNRVEQVVLYLLDGYLDQSRIAYMDNYYTTIKLAKFLAIHKTGICGTMRKNRVKIEKSFPIPQKRTECLFLIDRDKQLTLTVFYDSILVYMISSLEIPKIAPPKPGLYRTRPVYGKPTCIHKYNHGAQGVDHCNHRCAIYRYPHHNTKWWRPCYFHLLQLALSNAWVIYKEFYNKLNPNGLMEKCKKYKLFYKSVLEDLINHKEKISAHHKLNNTENFTYHLVDHEEIGQKYNYSESEKESENSSDEEEKDGAKKDEKKEKKSNNKEDSNEETESDSDSSSESESESNDEDENLLEDIKSLDQKEKINRLKKTILKKALEKKEKLKLRAQQIMQIKKEEIKDEKTKNSNNESTIEEKDSTSKKIDVNF